MRQKFYTPGISELSVQNIWDSGEMLSKDRCKTTSGFFVIPLLSQLWEEKNYCERRNELSSWRPVALSNPHKHLCLFKLGYDVHALLSSVMYILSGMKITAVYPMSRRRWDQNTTQVANRLNRARATYLRLLHLPPWFNPRYIVSFYIKLRDITHFRGKTTGFANWDPILRVKKDQNYGFRWG